MFKIALTGGIGSGKSTVCKLFTQLNVPVIDTDIIARELVKSGEPCLLKISDYFGADILLSDGSLNRKTLAARIFNNDKERLYLESILHPEIRQVIQRKTLQLNSCYVIIAIPLLIETNQLSEYDRILLIDCNEQQQIERTITRDKRSVCEVKSIMNSQATRQQRIAAADDIIDNSKDTANLKRQIKQLHTKYTKLCNNT